MTTSLPVRVYVRYGWSLTESINCNKEPFAWSIKIPFTIHQRNIQKLAIEMYQVNHKITPKLMRELFQKTEHPYNLQNDPTFRTCNIKHCTKNEVFH